MARSRKSTSPTETPTKASNVKEGDLVRLPGETEWMQVEQLVADGTTTRWQYKQGEAIHAWAGLKETDVLIKTMPPAEQA